MNPVNLAVEQIKSLPYAKVDSNFGQGVQAVLNQIKLLERDDPEETNQFITYSRECLASLAEMFHPHQLPSDYSYFLEYYGGLGIQKPGDDNSFDIYGIGPAVNIWYAHVKESNILSENYLKEGFLSIGTLILGQEYEKYDLFSKPYKHIHYYLDSNGNVHEERSFLVGNEFEIDELKKTAYSFTEWLAEIPKLFFELWQF